MEATSKQLDTLRYIVAYIDEHRREPTYREIAHQFGVCVTTVFDRIAALRRHGLIDSSAIRSTHATPTDKGRERVGPRCCPKCGHCEVMP